MPINHSIIVAYRNRRNSLNHFLGSLFFCAKNKYSPEIVITDLNSTDNSEQIIQQYQNKLNIKYLKVNYDGVFHKTKALNHAVLNSTGNYISMIDVDCIFPITFLDGIEEHFANDKYKNSKLCHRVRFVNNLLTNKINNEGDITEEMINYVVKTADYFRMAPERYTKNDITLNLLKPSQQKLPMINQAQGNSHFTMKKEIYYEIGGYDERFVGRGPEDQDFNHRLFLHLNEGFLKTNPIYNLYHLHHQHEKNWNTTECQRRNVQLFEENKRNNVVRLPLNDDFGQF